MKAKTQSSPCAEKQLLACCARTRLTPDDAQRIREIASQPLDWEYLLAEAEANSITPLVERHLMAIAAGALPVAVNEQLKRTSRANTVRCLYLTADLLQILERFSEQGIPALPYKGPVLAVQAYGDVALREFEDLDIILRQRDVPKAHEIILALGYKAKFDWILSPGASASLVPGEYNYRDEPRRAMVELHTEITLRHFPIKPDLDYFIARRAPVRISDHEVLTFTAEDLLPMLCIHGSKDFWERFSWVADVSELIQSHPDLNWDEVMRVTESLGALRMLFTGLALANGMLRTLLPAEILERVQHDHTACEIAGEMARMLMSRPAQTLDTAGRLRYRRQMLAGFVAGWRYVMRLAVVPAEEDWAMMRLPRSLAPLYIALRPFRLLRKYGWANREDAKPTA
ncbi:MAG: nucleotidyltransferase family protein [Candidatus Acidiferrales bacterium]